MIPKECKRLAEVDFPIAVVSKHSAREKKIFGYHPQMLNQWWARRPLASCRAMLLALLWPDPCDPNCPEEFKEKVREVLAPLPGKVGKTDEDLRKALLKFIGDFAEWDRSADLVYLEASRALVKAAHGDEPPLVVDPFAGGGSIPLEALRVGCDAFASDLNPVACLILKVMLEDIPRWGREKVKVKRKNGEEVEANGLADALRIVGKEIKEEAEKELADLYPKDPDLPAPRRGKFFIYVLKCADDSFYIGQTEDIPRRLKQHESGEVSWTAKHLPVEIIHWEQFDSREAAVKREQDLKTGFGRKWLKREYRAGRLAARQAGGATPIAYLWARTVRCEAPNCGAEIPLMRSFWLCKKPNRKRALRYKVVRQDGQAPHVEFEIFEPKNDRDVPNGTVTRAKATCLCCGTVLQPERVRAQLAEQKGGADVIFKVKGESEKEKAERVGGARMLAVVTLKPGDQGRHYRLPIERDYKAVWMAQKRIAEILDKWERGGRKGFCPVPDEPTPTGGGSGAGRAFSVQKYGMLQWGDLFTARQKVAILVIQRLLNLPICLNTVLIELLSFLSTRLADKNASLVSWDSGRETIGHVFSRQALPIVWDFVESAFPADSDNVLENSLSILFGVVQGCCKSIESFYGQTQLLDACETSLPDETTNVWFTDPPYYDAIPYSDLSDFFFVWLKRTLPGHPLLRDPFDPSNQLTPKVAEAVQNERSETADGRPKDRAFYEETMAKAFAEGRRVLKEDGVASVVFAHKTTEGWEALLSGMIRGGWTITGSWPIATERPGRLRSQDSAALATSVHLVCRPRPEDTPVGDWGEVLRELPKRIGGDLPAPQSNAPRQAGWMERLQNEGVRGADLVFACIGPALEIFSRYSKVETAEGIEVTLPEYLEKVWEVVGRSALEQVLGTSGLPAGASAQAGVQVETGAAGALEEDARLTALFLWTLQSTNGEAGEESKKVKGKRKKGEGEDQEIEEDEFDDEDDEDEERPVKGKTKGFSLIFDVVRRFAQPLGIHLPEWEGRIIETKKGVVRLLSVTERAKQLFGTDGTQAVADQIEQSRGGKVQGMLFPDMDETIGKKVKGKRKNVQKMVLAGDDSTLSRRRDATTLDRVHAAMLLQAGGRANALRALITEEMERGGEFLRLANALSALYPRTSEEKRLLDAMLLAVPR